jgi:hypothetical protein
MVLEPTLGLTRSRLEPVGLSTAPTPSRSTATAHLRH